MTERLEGLWSFVASPIAAQRMCEFNLTNRPMCTAQAAVAVLAILSEETQGRPLQDVTEADGGRGQRSEAGGARGVNVVAAAPEHAGDHSLELTDLEGTSLLAKR